MPDPTIVDVTTPNMQRLMLSNFCLSMINMLLALGVDPNEIDRLAVNFDGFSRRLDVGRLDASGRLVDLLASVACDPEVPETFAQPIGLPAQPGQTH